MTTDQEDTPIYAELYAEQEGGLPDIQVSEFQPWTFPQHRIQEEEEADG